MKTKIFSIFLLSFYLCLSSCLSGTHENKNKDAMDSTKAADTALRGRAGVIEKTPPVQYGDYVLKYPSGVIKMKGFYENGRRTGQWMSFFENGNVQSEGFYKEGIRDGKATVYFANGKVCYVGEYKDGKETGHWVFYDTLGVKVNEKVYPN